MGNREMDRNDLLAATRAEFLRGFSASLDDVIRDGAAQLFEKASNSPTLMEQSRLRDARGVLLNQNIALKRQLLGVMEQMLNRSFQTAYSTFRPSFGGSVNSSGLSLVDTSVFEDELHIDLLTKQLRNAVEDPLRDLNIRIALLFEQEDIKERENPFRPYLFARTITTALENIQVSRELIPILAQQLVEEMTELIPGIYDNLNALLAANGIAAQLQLKIRKSSLPPKGDLAREIDNAIPAFAETGAEIDIVEPRTASREKTWASTAREVVPVNRVDQLLEWVQGMIPAQAGYVDEVHVATGMASSRRHASDSVLGTQSAPSVPLSQRVSSPEKKSWLTEAHSVGDVLRNFFSPADASISPHAGYFDEPDADFSVNTAFSNADLTHAIYALQHSATPEVESMQDGEGRIRNLILERREELSHLSQGVDEQMIIDVVAMLFEFILRDPNVPAEVRAQLGRLQFLVLKVALLDPAMFTHKNHPARMLVNRIGSVVQDLQQIDPEGARVPEEIRRIVEVLLSDPSGDAALFLRMLDEFDAFVAKEMRVADNQVDQVVQALENAENRTLRFARTTALLAEALSHLKVDDYLHEFLVNTWTRVVERAGRESVDRAIRLRQFVPDLIWSIAPKVSDQDRRELFGLIPVLLDTLSTGVFSVGWSAQEQKTILDWLVDIHRHALRAGALQVQPPPRSYINDIFRQFVHGADSDLNELTASDRASGAFRELDGILLNEAINEMEVELSMLDKMLDPAMQSLINDADLISHPDEDLSQLCPDEVLKRLRSGVAIEITLDTHPSKAYLNWISSVASNMVISIDGLASPSVVSQKVFRRLWSAGRVKFLEDAPLFERAVQALLASADHQDHHLADPAV